LQNAIEKRCIICRWFLVCQFLAALRRSMSKLGCPAAFNYPAAIGDRPRFANSGYVSLGRSQSVQQPGEPWRFIATAYSQRFAASGARSPHVSAARHPCLSANGDRRRSTANSDRQRFSTIGSRQELATACQ
jgi:hypothetical protein